MKVLDEYELQLLKQTVFDPLPDFDWEMDCDTLITRFHQIVALYDLQISEPFKTVMDIDQELDIEETLYNYSETLHKLLVNAGLYAQAIKFINNLYYLPEYVILDEFASNEESVKQLKKMDSIRSLLVKLMSRLSTADHLDQQQLKDIVQEYNVSTFI